MKKFLFILMCVLISLSSGAQTLKAKQSVQTQQSMIATSTPTGKSFEGKPVYKSSRGSLFIIVVSKKTGNPYKKYLVEQ